MRELFALALSFDLKGLFLSPTANVALQAFRALFVGVLAFVADAGPMWLLSLTGLHYLVCGAIGFMIGVAVNYALSAAFVFTGKASVSKSGEIAVYVAVSLAGLGITEALLWFFTEKTGLYFMLSKCIAALIAFAWNFTVRKLTLYRGKP